MNKDRYHAIYLSPHLDDATLSCGGQIFQQTATGQRVLIVTITAGDPSMESLSTYVQSLHERWQLATEAVAARRAEDLAANRILGADTLHWALPDCIYRFDPATQKPFYLSDTDIFGEPHPSEWRLVDELAEQMRQLPPHDRIFAPLVIGHHVDHQLTRLAAERCVGENLFYYEDYPYAQKPGALESVIPPGSTDWQAEPVALTEAALQAKIEAILAFRSQLSTFFVDRADLERQVRGYAASIGGERIWRRIAIEQGLAG
jgi:LmbE family N-acetylglucosaminyl deacetylase